MVGKPKNEVAMTSAERSRLYRERKKKQGTKEVNIHFSEYSLSKLDELVEFFNLPNRSTAIAQLIETPLNNALISMHALKSNDDLDDIVNNESYGITKEQLAESWQELWPALSSIVWKGICSQDKQTQENIVSYIESLSGKQHDR